MKVILNLVFLAISPLFAGETTAVTLRQAMEAASERPSLAAERQETEAVIQEAKTARRASSLPRVEASLAYRYADPVRALDTPLGPLPQGDRDTGLVRAFMQQPLIDIPNRRYNVPALEKAAEASAQRTEAIRQSLAAGAGHAFLDVLRIDANLRATRGFIKSLDQRTTEVSVLVDEGRALRADLLKIKLRAEDAKLNEIRLLNQRKVATLSLGRAVGKDHQVEPLDQLDELPGANPDVVNWKDRGTVSEAFRVRPDLAALNTRAEALDLERKGVFAERLPRLDAQISWEAIDPSPFTDDAFVEGTLAVTWKPFASGTRKTRAAQVRARQNAVHHQIVEAQRGIAVAVTAAFADWHTAIEAVSVRGQDVIQARETLRVESERYQNGRATLNDVLDFEALLQERKALEDLARIDLTAAWIDLRLAKGSL